MESEDISAYPCSPRALQTDGYEIRRIGIIGIVITVDKQHLLRNINIDT